MKNFLKGIKYNHIFEYLEKQKDFVKEKFLVSILIFILSEKLFSMFCLYLMASEEIKRVYKPESIFRQLDSIHELMKKF